MERIEAAELLGIAPTASPRQVRSAFRKRVRADHPDRNRDSDTDFQRLVEARDLLLTPAPEPEPEPPLPPRPPTPPKTTLTYGYEPYQDDGLEEFITRPPNVSLGSQQTQASPSLLSRLRRLGWQILVMGALALLFFQIVLRGLVAADDRCVSTSDTGPADVTCRPGSRLQIEERFPDITATCPPPSEGLRVGSELWCVVPYNG